MHRGETRAERRQVAQGPRARGPPRILGRTAWAQVGAPLFPREKAQSDPQVPSPEQECQMNRKMCRPHASGGVRGSPLLEARPARIPSRVRIRRESRAAPLLRTRGGVPLALGTLADILRRQWAQRAYCRLGSACPGRALHLGHQGGVEPSAAGPGAGTR